MAHAKYTQARKQITRVCDACENILGGEHLTLNTGCIDTCKGQ